MKAAVVRQHGTVELMDIADPVPGPYDCLVEIDACATCTGTDLSLIHGTFPWLKDTPYIVGHESTGIIVEVGEKVANFRVGQRVTRPAGILPGHPVDGIGSMWGGFAEKGLVRDTEKEKAEGKESDFMHMLACVPLADDVDAASAAYSLSLIHI